MSDWHKEDVKSNKIDKFYLKQANIFLLKIIGIISNAISEFKRIHCFLRIQCYSKSTDIYNKYIGVTSFKFTYLYNI